MMGDSMIARAVQQMEMGQLWSSESQLLSMTCT